MSQYFDDYLRIALIDAERSCSEALAQDMAEAAARGSVLNGRRWIYIEKILVDSLQEFGREVEQKLVQFDHEHTPVTSSDFDSAVNAIHQFKDRCESIHSDKRSKLSSTYPESRPPFPEGELERAESHAINNILGQKKAFQSKRSFWKWALGDLQKRIWSGSIFLIGAALGGLIGRIFQYWPLAK